MRPKSPFLQNLRKKTPQPQMKQRGKADPTPHTGVPKATERGFQPFDWKPRSTRVETVAVQPDPELVGLQLNRKLMSKQEEKHTIKDTPRLKLSFAL